MWTTTNFQLASVIDSIHGVAWGVAAKNVETRKQPEKPKPVGRPMNLREKQEASEKTLQHARAMRNRRRRNGY